MEIQHLGLEVPVVCGFPEGSGRQKGCCNAICDSPMTVKVKDLRPDFEFKERN